MAQWLSWLERRPVTAEVESSSLFWVVYGVLAQLGEHLPYKQRVIGSSPIGPIQYGWIPEWPKGADCKSVGNAFEGSNPSPSTEEQKREPKYLWSKTKTVRILLHPPAAVAELADAQDLKSCEG